ncbi:MAG: peptidoglycan DD-metalloendopeptidase family protein [Nitrospinae bacterium]|nr:peptidoglycan DD-metalloendopeptidase family protein [Nitrospinota bacterium]
MFKVKLTAPTTLLFLSLCFFSFCYEIMEAQGKTAKEISHEEKKLNKINSELNELTSKISLLKQQEESQFLKLDFINKKIEKHNTELRRYKKNLHETKKRKEKTKEETLTLNKRIKEKRKALQKRLIQLYKTGTLSEMELLFNSSGIKNYLKNKKYLQHLSRKDFEKIEEIDTLIKNQTVLRSKLEKEEKNIIKFQKLALQKRNDIYEEKTNKKKAINEIKKQKNYYFSKKKKLEEASKQVKRLISTLSRVKKPTSVVKKHIIIKDFYKTKGKLMWPIEGKVITHFGKEKSEVFGTYIYHDGIEIVSHGEINVKSVFKGKVLFNTPFENFGNMIVLDHGDGYYSLYAYLKKVLVDVGDVVDEGEKIALIGDNSIASSPTLYFEIRKRGNAINPEVWFQRN